MDVFLFLYYRCNWVLVRAERSYELLFQVKSTHLLIQTKQNWIVYIKPPNMRYAHSVFTKADIKS